MSISGSQLVQDALTGCGAYGIGDNLDDGDAQLVLRRLNRLLDSWANENLLIYQKAIDTLTMVTGTASYSAITSLASTVRPVSIDSWYVRLSGVDYSGQVIDNQSYGYIKVKTVTGIPRLLYPDSSATDVTLNFYPAPDKPYVLYLTCRRLISSSPITLSTVFAGPPGYERALVDNLALDIGPSFGRQPDPITAAAAKESKAVLKRQNYTPLVLDGALPGEHQNHRSNIFTDNA